MPHIEAKSVRDTNTTIVKFSRLGGNGIQGRWYFEVLWRGKFYHVEHQPNNYKYSRAAVLRDGAYRDKLAEKIRLELPEDLLNQIVGTVESLSALHALYPRMRRDSDKLRGDFAGFFAALVLQNCQPEPEMCAHMENRLSAYLRADLVVESTKTKFQLTCGSNLDGWYWLREVPEELCSLINFKKMAFKFKKVKLSGRNYEEYQSTLIRVLNIASVIAQSGYLADDRQRETPQASGRHWFRELDARRYQLWPSSNDYWANVHEEGETYIVLTFSYRYDATGHSFHDAVMAAVDFQFTERYENIVE